MVRGGATRQQLETLRPELGKQLDVAASRWFRFLLDFDPRPVLGRVRCPALAVYGALDLQAPPELNAGPMRDALQRGRVEVLPGLNHMLQHAASGSPLEYAQIEETVAPEALELVAKWLGGQ
jgi:fermentation-respiration switch protein FrsA (DUF1100 family)